MTICNMSIEAGGARGHDRSRRHHVRVPGGPARRAEGLRRRGRALARAAHRRGATLRHRGHGRRRGAQPAGDLGHEPGQVAPVDRPRARSRRRSTARPTARRPSGRSPTWRSSRARRSRTSSSTASSSAPARTRASRTCARRRRWSRAGKVAADVRAMVVPGSQQVKAQAEREGLDEVFTAAGFEWREAGCSMCLGMNPDILAAGRALRLDLEPQLRGPPGARRPHAPGQPADGRGGGDRRPLRRHPGVEVSGSDERRDAGRAWKQERRRHRLHRRPAQADPAVRRAGGARPAPDHARRTARSAASATSAPATAASRSW